MSKYLLFDTETGGLNPQDFDLLTASFFVIDPVTHVVIDELDLKIKAEKSRVSSQALSVNNIDLDEHNQKAISKEEASKALKGFLAKHSGFKTRLIPLGHNIRFDINFVKTQLVPNWDDYISYEIVDTLDIARFLIKSGAITTSNAKLETIANFFKIEFLAHDAREDALTTFEVYKKMQELVKPVALAK